MVNFMCPFDGAMGHTFGVNSEKPLLNPGYKDFLFFFFSRGFTVLGFILGLGFILSLIFI